MLLRLLLVMFVVLVPLGCKKSSAPVDPNLCEHPKDPKMKRYFVHFTGFSPKAHKALLRQVHLKYFKTGVSGDITRTHPEPGAHMLHVIRKNPVEIAVLRCP